MKAEKITVVDYGAGNVLSVIRSFEHFGADVTVTSDPKVIEKSSKLVLPGVGAFPSAMKTLRNTGIDVAIKSFVEQEKPLLAICLGMQLLMQRSFEFEETTGLELIQGSVVHIGHTGLDRKISVPHIGWNEIRELPGAANWKDSILSGIKPESPFYFVHSYMALPEIEADTLAITLLHDLRITAALQKNYMTGVQFHPEKSGSAGLKLIHSFLTKRY